MVNKYKGILAVDFDDTIADTTYPEIHGLKKGARKYINKLYEDSWYIIIWTCRSEKNLQMCYEFLEKEGINYHKLNEQNPDLVNHYGETRKISADFYIDDKNISGLPSWKKIYKKLSMIDFKSCLSRIYNKQLV